MRWRKILVTLGICSGIGVGAGALAHRFVPESPVVRGLLVGDRFVPRRGSPAAWLAVRRDEARRRVIRFQYDDQSFESTLGEAGVEIDVAATLERASAVGHQGSLTQRLREASQARDGKIDVPIVWSINKARAKALLERIAERIDRPPVDAKLDMEHRVKVPDVLGRALDIDASIQAIAEGKHHDEETIYLPVRYVTAKTTIEDLVQVDIEKVVYAHETTFTTWGTGAGRAVNIRNAAAKIDGTILAPGAVFSFNDTVGPRTREQGFTLAPEIQGDELLPGIGGGTCQVSSTLHVAAVYGALDILDRQSHSKPSSYTPLGLDATVSYPIVDLKIKNSLPYPIMIHAYLPRPTAVRVEILGGDPVAKVSYTYAVSRKEDFMRRIVVKSYFEPGRRRLHQKGSRGYDVTSFVTLQFNNGSQDQRHYFSGYRPFPEIFWVAPGYDEAELPPLPEHAKGVEGQVTTAVAESDAASYPM